VKDDLQVLGLAARITKPVPLAALAVLALTVVALTLIGAGVVNAGTQGMVVLSVVAAIALVALIVAVIVAKPVGLSVKTSGDLSPGVVGGDYSVGAETVRQGGDRKSHKGVGDNFNPSSIETKGSHSPGKVGGDYSVQKK
jgi:hypothetical protein